ncbi:hypothetical protein ACWERY_05840 [Streptomyces sp. NPDC004082]|uniref:hypothetical protein n=1 Tax=Streptomyces sp. NPDC005481 TaxID=3154881 RepID=UPI0033AFB954
MSNTSPDTTSGAVPEASDASQERTAAEIRTELELQAALEALAGGVRSAPDVYRSARADWRRRERRRRLVLTVLIAVVFALATLIGLWVLNQTPTAESGVVYSGVGGTAAGTGPG